MILIKEVKEDDPKYAQIKHIFEFLVGPLKNFLTVFRVYQVETVPGVETVPVDDEGKYTEIGFFSVASLSEATTVIVNKSLYKYPADCIFASSENGDGLYHLLLCRVLLRVSESSSSRRFFLPSDQNPCVPHSLISFGGPIISELHGNVKQLLLTRLTPCDIIEAMMKMSILLLNLQPSPLIRLVADFKEGKLSLADVMKSIRRHPMFPQMNEIYTFYLEPLLSEELKDQLGPIRSLLVSEDFWDQAFE